MKYYKYFFRNYHQPVIISDSDTGKIIEVNQQLLNLLNKSNEDFLNLKRTDIYPQKAIRELNKKIRGNNNTPPVKTFIIDKEGNKINVEINSELVEEDDRKILVDFISLKNDTLNTPETSFLSFIKNLPVLFYHCKNDRNWTMEYISEGCFALTGYTAEQLINNKEIAYGSLIAEEDKELVWKEINSALAEKKVFRIVYRILTADNQVKWVWEQGNGIFSDDNKLLYIEGIIIDVTEQKLTQQALEYSEAKFRSLVEESLVGVYIIQDGKFSYVNPRLAEIFGYTPGEILLGVKVSDLVHESDIPEVEENIRKRLSGEVQTIHYFFKGLKKDKTVIDVEVMGSFTQFNGMPAIIGTAIDITEKKKAEREIRKLSSAVEQSPVSIIITDINGNIEYVNPKFTEVTGYTFEEVKGKNPRILKYGDTPRVYYENLWKTILAGDEWYGEFLNKKKNGELFWEFTSISPIKNSNGEIINFLAIKEDITERKNLEEELKLSKEKAEELSRLKSVFLANISHELRTPMVSILGYSEILKSEIVNPDLRYLAREIYDSSYRFMKTLNLILDLSRIESNREVINLIELDAVSIAKEEFLFFHPSASRKKLELKLKIPDEPIITLLDERMLRQVINSLTSNAVKFTIKGNITLEIDLEAAVSGQNLIIKISDTGIGIPKNNQNVIFDAFRQLSEGLNKSYEGAGLGLAVAKKFVDMMNGTIEVESEFGKGSVFTVRFPILRRSEMQPQTLGSSNMNNLSEDKTKQAYLLLVEDDQSNAGVIKFFLENIYSIDSVSNGEEAIVKASSKKYDAVLMDIDLGTGMSGLEAARKIRNLPGYENTPVIAVTALAMRGDKEKFLKEGCTHYISKPFKKDDLLNIIKTAINNS